MIFKCYSTGSKGNVYTLENSKGDILLIELGLPYNKILTNISDITKVCGIIVSHKHKDHNYGDNVKRFITCGYEVLYPENDIVIGKKYTLGSFEVIPLPCKHNVSCCGYLIKTDNTIIMFATDTKTLPKVRNKVDIFLVEINYIEEWVEHSIQELEVNDSSLAYKSRLLLDHHSLEKAIMYFKNLNYKPRAILTLHNSLNESHFNHEQVLNELNKLGVSFCDIVANGDEYIL